MILFAEWQGVISLINSLYPQYSIAIIESKHPKPWFYPPKALILAIVLLNNYAEPFYSLEYLPYHTICTILGFQCRFNCNESPILS